jgi:hypothetical protein
VVCNATVSESSIDYCADARSSSGLVKRVQLHKRESTGYGEHRAINGFPRESSADNRNECRKSAVTSSGVGTCPGPSSVEMHQ